MSEPQRSHRRRPGGRFTDWPRVVSGVGGWLLSQSSQGGLGGVAASAAVTLVSRSAELVGEVSAEVLKATRDPEPKKARPARPRRRATTKPETAPRPPRA